MTRTNTAPVPYLARYSTAIYFLAVLMVLMPPLDIILSMPQYLPRVAMWRFGAIGLLSGAMLLPIAGLLLAGLTAAASGHRWMNRMVLVCTTLAGLLFLLVLVLFALDAIQVRRDTAPELLRRFDVAVLKTLIMQVTQTVAVVLVARSAWRAGRSIRVREPRSAEQLYAGTPAPE